MVRYIFHVGKTVNKNKIYKNKGIELKIKKKDIRIESGIPNDVIWKCRQNRTDIFAINTRKNCCT